MEIIIEQQDIDIFKISVDGHQRYYGYHKLRNWHTYIDIVSLRGVRPQVFVEMKKKYRFFRSPQFEVNIKGQESPIFESLTRNGRDFQLTGPNYIYQLIGHKNTRASFFKDEVQIGYISDLATLPLMNGDKYKLIADYDSDLNFLLPMAMMWNYIQFYPKGTSDGFSINVKVGQFKESQPPNFKWTPKASPEH